MSDYIEVVGWREVRQAVRKSKDSDLPKRIGQAHKRTGQFVIDNLEPRPDPRAIGKGGGSTVRPSASKREVLIRTGGKHRADHSPEQQWGKRQVRNIRRPAPPRPYIRRTAARHLDGKIGDVWLQEIARALEPAFHETEP